MASTIEALLLAQVSVLGNNSPQLVQSTILNATTASVTYTVTTAHPRIQIIWSAACTASGGQVLLLQFNGDTTNTHYADNQNENSVSTVTGSTTNPVAAGPPTGIKLGVISGTGGSYTTNYWASGQTMISDANQSSHFPTLYGNAMSFQTGTTAWVGTYGAIYLQATPITSITLLPATGNFASGSTFSFYGLS